MVLKLFLSTVLLQPPPWSHLEHNNTNVSYGVRMESSDFTSLTCTVVSSGMGLSSLSLSSLIYKVEVTVAPICFEQVMIR